MKKMINTFMILLLCVFSIQVAQAASEKYLVNSVEDVDSATNGTTYFSDGDFSVLINMETRLKIWSIIGEPVVNCFHRVNSVGSVSYKGDLLVDIPESIKNKIRINFPAHLFSLTNNNFVKGHLICQSGIDRGVGKWSANFPGSPNWNRFLFAYTAPSNDERYTDYANRVSYYSAKTAKALMKEVKSKGVKYLSASSSNIFPDRSADMSAVKQWYLEEEKKKLAAKSKEVAQLRKRQEQVTKAKPAKDDLFAEMDNDYFEKAVETESKKVLKDVYAPLRKMEQKFEVERRQIHSVLSKKQSTIEGLAPQISKAKKGELRVKAGSTDSRQRYLALFVPPVTEGYILIKGGSFSMGRDNGVYGDEEPIHTVHINSFKMSIHEVTQAQWQAVMGSNPSSFKGDNRPVEGVSWDAIQQFIRKLNAQTGQRFRLPTEAEWEYAARAGSSSKYSWGNSVGSGRANCNGCGSQYDSKTAPVGSFSANSFGLYDMYGNVAEWVQDCYHGNYRGAPTDGSAWQGGGCGERVLRGGSWFSLSYDVGSAGRYGDSAGSRDNYNGFRLVQD